LAQSEKKLSVNKFGMRRLALDSNKRFSSLFLSSDNPLTVSKKSNYKKEKKRLKSGKLKSEAIKGRVSTKGEVTRKLRSHTITNAITQCYA